MSSMTERQFTEADNKHRVEVARSTVQHFCARTSLSGSGILYDDCESVVADLIADLFHLCDEEGVNVSAVIRRARDHYNDEVGDPA